MLWWIVDRAMLFYVLLAMLTLGLAACWWRTRQGKYLIAVAVPVILIAIVFLLTLFIVSDRQRLELNVREMADGVLEGRPQAVFKHFARDLRIGNRSRSEFEQFAQQTIRKRGITYIKLWDFDVEELSRPENKARVAFRVRAESRWGDFWALCRAYFVLEGNDWKLHNLEVFNAVANTKEPITIPLP